MAITTKSIKGFTLVKPNTKRGNTIRWYFDHVNKGGLYDCYVRPSYAKVRAYDNCMTMVREYKGFGEKITGYNSCTFSFHFTFRRKDKKTGDVTTYIAHITKEHNYLLPIKVVKYNPNGWKIDKIMSEIESLSHSQGFYERLYAQLVTIKESNAEKWQAIVKELEAQCFTDAVSMVLYFEQ